MLISSRLIKVIEATLNVIMSEKKINNLSVEYFGEHTVSFLINEKRVDVKVIEEFPNQIFSIRHFR